MSLEIYAAGAAAAFTVDVLIYPLDTLKTRYQSQDYIKTYASSTRNAALSFRGLYQGIGAVVVATLPAAGLFFSTYESTTVLFKELLPVPEPLVHSAASGVAEMVSCLILAPAEVIKQNAQMLTNQKSRQAGSSTSMQTYRQLAGQGVGRRLFTGYTALVARNLPFTALQFPAFEYVRTRLRERRGGAGKGDPAGLLETGLIGGTSAASAGAFAAFVTTPSDVVKTRMMILAGQEGPEGSQRGSLHQQQSAWKVTQQVFHERGLRGFFRGGLFRSAWTAMGSGLYLGTYDVAKTYLERRNSGPDEEAVSM